MTPAETIQTFTPVGVTVVAALIGLLLWRFRSIDKRISEIKNDIKEMEEDVRRRDNRMHDKLGKHIDESHSVVQEVAVLKERQAHHGKRIETLEKKVFETKQ